MTQRLWLVGAGHAHAVLLRRWAQQGLPSGVTATLMAPSHQVPYSGMVPGWLAGRYRFDEICLDMRALATAAGVGWCTGELRAIDAASQRVHLADGSSQDYGLLSLNVGSTLSPPDWPGVRMLALRPLSALHDAWGAVLGDRPPAGVLTVGGGAAGVEATLAIIASLRLQHPQWRAPGRLVTRGRALLDGWPPRAQRAAFAALARAGVAVQCGTEADAAMAPPGTLVLWATGATAHAWQRQSALAQDADGFIATDATLRSTSHPAVFASGDCASLPQRLPKAGVYAVRQGSLLAHNLRAVLEGRPLKAFSDDGAALALLSTADGRAIAKRGAWSAAGPRLGRLLWRWKDHIDRAFVRGGS